MVGDRPQEFATVPERDFELLEILLRQLADDRKVDCVGVETLRIFAHSDRCEPIYDRGHGWSDFPSKNAAMQADEAVMGPG